MLLDLHTDSQEVGKVVWYSYLFKNFAQFVMIHTVKGFGVVNKAEVDVFLELSSATGSVRDEPCDQCRINYVISA